MHKLCKVRPDSVEIHVTNSSLLETYQTLSGNILGLPAISVNYVSCFSNIFLISAALSEGNLDRECSPCGCLDTGGCPRSFWGN